jgi:hypothetical protein
MLSLDPTDSLSAQNGMQHHLDIQHSPSATFSVKPSTQLDAYVRYTQRMHHTEVTATASTTQCCKANAAFHWKLMYFWFTKMQGHYWYDQGVNV